MQPKPYAAAAFLTSSGGDLVHMITPHEGKPYNVWCSQADLEAVAAAIEAHHGAPIAATQLAHEVGIPTIAFNVAIDFLIECGLLAASDGTYTARGAKTRDWAIARYMEIRTMWDPRAKGDEIDPEALRQLW